ncbi:hypothetical protein AB0B13_34465 [Streptomyces sp. NPDC042898]|uniref:protein kinase domain-containing protein n=1 Tax=Streptomyces sp. NPDC042898 TaxID=3154334 RepID=UPI0033E2F5D3
MLCDAAGPKAIDFGIARAFDGTVLTAAGMAVGTLGFMSPEQLDGTGFVGPASDVFSLGVLLCWAATGRRPLRRRRADRRDRPDRQRARRPPARTGRPAGTRGCLPVRRPEHTAHDGRPGQGVRPAGRRGSGRGRTSPVPRSRSRGLPGCGS